MNTYQEKLDNRVVFIVIARFPISNSNKENGYELNYILYNFRKKEIYVVSEEKLKILSDYTLNMSYHDFAQMFTTVWFLAPMSTIHKPNLTEGSQVLRFGKITIEILNKTLYNHPYVELIIHNVLKGDTDNSWITVCTDRIELTKRNSLYNKVRILRHYNEESKTTNISIYNVIGCEEDKSSQNCENLYKRSLIKSIHNGKEVETIINKAIMVGIENISIDYINIDNNNYLLNEKPVLLSNIFNKIGYEYAIELISGYKGDNLRLSKEQAYSILYNLHMWDDTQRMLISTGQQNYSLASLVKRFSHLKNKGIISID